MAKAKIKAKTVVKAKATRKKKADTFDWNNVGDNVMKNAEEISKNINDYTAIK